MSFSKINRYAQEGIPFVTIISYDKSRVLLYRVDELKKEGIAFSLDENASYNAHNHTLSFTPTPFIEYKKKFNRVQEYIKKGESYLLNLTQETPIDTKLSLEAIFTMANAPFKLLKKGEFVCFSPERFIKIDNCTLSTYPMKGTIDASIKGAKAKLEHDPKELAEHIMIVDLLRNDLSIVGKQTRVEKFRYIHPIKAGNRELYQASSHITTELKPSWREELGDILSALLPAGSITGTPKKRTIEIIEEIEGYSRGFFSGIFGYFDGQSFDSAVMIRFIEQSDRGLVYKSGGGITCESDVRSEYEELLAKIYLP